MKQFFLHTMNIKKNSDTRIFFICLLISSVLWLLINLSKEYRSTVDVLTEYKNPPSGKVLFDERQDTIRAEINATGATILKYKIKNPTVKVKLNEVLLTNNNSNFWLPNRFLNMLEQELAVEEIYRVEKDTIHLLIDELGRKKVPIVSRIKVLSNQGFKVVNENLSQDSVEINGPKSVVKKVKTISTEEIVFENKENNFTQKIKLEYPQRVKGVKVLDYQVTLEKYTEKTITIAVKPINVPLNTQIQMFPETVEIKFTVGYSKFNEIKPQDFQVICDVKQLNDTLTLVPLKIKKQPKEIENIRIIPAKTKVLLVKSEN